MVGKIRGILEVGIQHDPVVKESIYFSVRDVFSQVEGQYQLTACKELLPTLMKERHCVRELIQRLTQKINQRELKVEETPN